MKILIRAITLLRILFHRCTDQLRSFYWKTELQRMGATIAPGFVVKRGVQISWAKGARMEIGYSVVLAENSRIHLGPQAHLKIGDKVFLGVNSVIACRSHIHIGDQTQVAHNVTIIDHDHDLHHIDTLGQTAPIEIGKNVWIGANALLLKGITVEDSAVIGAGAIATKRVPTKNLAIGKSAENHPLSHASF